MGYRDYMARNEGWGSFGSGLTPVVKGLIWANAIVFLLFNWALKDLFEPYVQYLTLSRAGLLAGLFWQPVTYQFLHANLSHIFMNMLGLYFLGPDTERTLGQRRFLFLYLFSGILGGLGFVMLDANAFCLGASGSLYGILAAFAALYPMRELALAWFPFVSFKAWKFALVFGAIELLSMLNSSRGGIANSAHLVGGLVGWFYARALTADAPSWPRVSTWFRAHRTGRPTGAPSASEINRILDKVAAKGLHSLTMQERERLDQASRHRTSRK